MGKEKSELGPTGATVVENLRSLIDRRSISFNELSRQLDAVGRRIPPLGLRKIVAGERRIDVDELLALATVLRIPPTMLLTPEVESRDEKVTATGIGELTAAELWKWFSQGEHPHPATDPREAMEDLAWSLPRWTFAHGSPEMTSKQNEFFGQIHRDEDGELRPYGLD